MDDDVHTKPRPGELAIKLARLNNVLVTPRGAVKDSMLTYMCPLCDNKVVLRKGLIRRPHFAHKARSKQDGLDNQEEKECLVVQMARLHQRESLDHKLAKLRIEKASCLLLVKACKFCQAKSEAQSFKVVEACTEKCLLVEDKKYVVDVFLQVVQESSSGSTPTTIASLVVEVFHTHAIKEKFDALTQHGLSVYELCANNILECKDVSELLVDTTTWECQTCQQKHLDLAKQEEERVLRLQAEHQAQSLKMTQQAEQQAEQAKLQANLQPKREYSQGASRSVQYCDQSKDFDHVDIKKALLESIKAEIASSSSQITNEWRARRLVCKVNNQTAWPYLDATMNMKLDVPFDEKDYAKRWYNSEKYGLAFEDKFWWPYNTEERRTETQLSCPEAVEAWSEYSFMQRVYFTPDKYSFKQAKQAGMLHKVGQVWHNYFRGVNAAELALKYGKQCCRVNLCVPFREKDKAKALQQVYWDSNLRTWYSCCCMTWVCKRYAYGFHNMC